VVFVHLAEIISASPTTTRANQITLRENNWFDPRSVLKERLSRFHRAKILAHKSCTTWRSSLLCPFSSWSTILIARVLRLNRGIAERIRGLCRFSASFLNSPLPVSNRREATVAGKLFVRLTTFFHRPPPSRKIDDPFHIFSYIHIHIHAYTRMSRPARGTKQNEKIVRMLWLPLTYAYFCARVPLLR